MVSVWWQDLGRGALALVRGPRSLALRAPDEWRETLGKLGLGPGAQRAPSLLAHRKKA